jgi:predicted RecA/RadA family phage recombinase
VTTTTQQQQKEGDPVANEYAGEVIRYTPTTGVAAGEAVAVGVIVGVASRPIAANELGNLNVEGIFSITAPAGVIAQGAKVSLYQGQAVTGSTGVGMGVAAIAKASGDATVSVLLIPGI